MYMHILMCVCVLCVCVCVCVCGCVGGVGGWGVWVCVQYFVPAFFLSGLTSLLVT